MNWLLTALLYCSAAVFVVGMIYRLVSWLRAPVPLKLVLTPGPATAGGVGRRVAGEVVLFHSLHKTDRALWTAAWLFHVSLLLLAIGHVGGLVIPGFIQTSLGLSEEQFHHLSNRAGGASGILAMITLLYLFFRRLASERLRWISTFSDYLALGLLLLIIVTGNQMRFMDGLEIEQARRFVRGLLALQPVAPPANTMFSVHFLLVCALLAYIPFSKLIHMGGLALSPTLNQRNNPREERYASGTR